MRSFRDAYNSVIADLTPQPWTHTVGDRTLTVIPAGFRADRDDAEEWVKTPEVQRLVDAVTAGESWTSVYSGWGLEVTVAEPGVTVAVWEKGEATTVVLPSSERLPFASAIRRALDVARGWED